MQHNIETICILGGGTAGWMTAAALSKLLPTSITITLVESAEIANVGVGEATIPQIQLFNQLLEIDEDEFIRRTKATFKHGIEFVDWRKLGHSYMHPFGTLGLNFNGLDFHHYWLKMTQSGLDKDIQNFAFNSVAAKSGKMMRSINVPNSPLNNIAYAYHFDAGLYVELLKDLSLQNQVHHLLGTVKQVTTDNQTGFINQITLADKQQIAADLFIDCSGSRGVLIEQALNVGYQSWQHYLPCDSAVVAPSKLVGDAKPHTRSTAQAFGWQWQIPLQHRMGNGYVYSSKFVDDESAKQSFCANVDGELLEPPRIIRFNTGVRNKFWHKNCVAIGLSGGFIEPLESTAIHLIQSGISRLMSLFPNKDMDHVLIDKYNQQAMAEMMQIRDFIILHYHVTERDDSTFWNYCRNMAIPETLAQKLALFQQQGRIFRDNEELFNQTSWLSVMLGQGIMPKSYHPLADVMSEQDIQQRMANIESVINQSVAQMPTQAEFLQQILGR